MRASRVALMASFMQSSGIRHNNLNKFHLDNNKVNNRGIEPAQSEDKSSSAPATNVTGEGAVAEEEEAVQSAWSSDGPTVPLPVNHIKYHAMARRPRGKLSPNATTADNVPILHPHAMNLIPIPPTPDMIGKPEKFSFQANAQVRNPHMVNLYHVPNNTAPVLAPMHQSSLTVPSMELRRFCKDTWVSMESSGVVPDEKITQFVSWIKSRSLGASVFHEQLDTNISLSLGKRYVRGVHAQRSFLAGETILEIPIEADPSNEAGYGVMINSERLRLCSRAANVASERSGSPSADVPTYETVRDIVNHQRNMFDREYHPMFIDQIHASLYIALERSIHERSPIYPYLNLFPEESVIDDDFVVEVHRGVADTMAIYEYKALIDRARGMLVDIQRKWEGAPPLLDMMWAYRFVISRQRMLTHTRQDCDHLIGESSNKERFRNSDIFTNAIRAGHKFFLKNIVRAYDEQQDKINDFNPRTSACLVPIIDMIGNDPAGISANVRIDTAGHDAENTRLDAPIATSIKITALEDIPEGRVLQLLYPRCYSVSYTLFRFGYLPLLNRELDMTEALRQNGLSGSLSGESELGVEGYEAPRRFFEETNSGEPKWMMVEAAKREKAKTIDS